MEQSDRKRPPSFASIYTYRRSSTSPFCRITGKSHSMDEHHYVFSPDDFVKFESVSSCRITEKHSHFKDYKYAYPIIDLDGVTRMVTEHDFHCRITSKYKAMAGHKYVYPLLGCPTDKTVDEMVSVVEEESMTEVFVPSEVEVIVRGGIKDILKAKDSEHMFIQSKEGSVFPAALKVIYKKKETPGSNRVRRHTLPVSLEAAAIANELKEVCSPTIKLLKDIKVKPAETAKIVFDLIPEDVELLKDIRKTRPKRPGRSKNKENEKSKKKKTKHQFNESEEIESIMPPAKPMVLEEIEVVNEAPKRLSRLEKYKLQFHSFEEKSSCNTGNRLTLVGAFNKDEIEELDFSDPVEVPFTESFESLKHQSVTTCKILRAKLSSPPPEEIAKEKDTADDSRSAFNEVGEEDSKPKSFKELQSFIGSKLNLEKALKFQSSNESMHTLNSGKNNDTEQDINDGFSINAVSDDSSLKESRNGVFTKKIF